MKIIIATIKTWNIEKAKEIKDRFAIEHDIRIIENKDTLSLELVRSFKPDYIFFPHWSYFIPASIYENYACVVFHMTDLPFGRGGSPLQNLIVRGYKETQLSAIKVEKEIDSGAIYFKKKLSLDGSAEEIYRRASEMIFEEMIPLFLEKKELNPVKQYGQPVYFKRRTAEESQLKKEMTLSQIYDYIRMLDAEGYPNAFIAFGKYKVMFKKAIWNEKEIRAEVVIVEED